MQRRFATLDRAILLIAWNYYRVATLFLVAASLFAAESGSPPTAPKKELPLAGEPLLVDGHIAFIIRSPKNSTQSSKPWVWYAPTLPGLPGREERWMFEQFLAAGISIAGIDVGESYGSPAGRALFTSLYQEMIKRGYSAKPVLLGRSRGGLMALSWAEENAEKVGAFAGIYPVCNVESYPGIAKAAPAYGMSAEELGAKLREHNPIDRLSSLARARVPLFAIHGDVDTLVPLDKNSGLLKDRYSALGGRMELIVPPGQGHNMWEGFFQCAELVAFVKAEAGPALALSSPREYQVIQRRTRDHGQFSIAGELSNIRNKSILVEARLLADGKVGAWAAVPLNREQSGFHAEWNAPPGAWHRLEIRARSDQIILAEAVVEHFGVGEIFVIAGQSNSANHGEERQTTKTGQVAVFDGNEWKLANDPQPGASGSGGSFIPPFADALVKRFKVPVGVIACGVGATSVREWLPRGFKFTNPPTLLGNVHATGNGEWESNGTIYDTFTRRLKQLGIGGFRAVLWHQGESDANQADPSRTLPGALYKDYLRELIIDTRREIGWAAPWFVAQASYHTPADEGSDEIRAAQAALWQDGVALPGPDSDLLKAEWREDSGRGVHFSGRGLRQHAILWVDKVAPWLEQQLTPAGPRN